MKEMYELRKRFKKQRLKWTTASVGEGVEQQELPYIGAGRAKWYLGRQLGGFL